eukprot:CAMPEP_0115048444 /NCGR_PEP_ID=MMETSP0227-20121206/581_1 /TAXON_ID=89957 /ORGANISM="Polarella glacialis, Strain CCMP 1383" /LENGTH=131 /DNA_ID=CAMNT_0002431887 /DNA_START=673 /DNA_END=1069 /DNA_ORIENTATION=-
MGLNLKEGDWADLAKRLHILALLAQSPASAKHQEQLALVQQKLVDQEELRGGHLGIEAGLCVVDEVVHNSRSKLLSSRLDHQCPVSARGPHENVPLSFLPKHLWIHAEDHGCPLLQDACGGLQPLSSVLWS